MCGNFFFFIQGLRCTYNHSILEGFTENHREKFLILITVLAWQPSAGLFGPDWNISPITDHDDDEDEHYWLSSSSTLRLTSSFFCEISAQLPEKCWLLLVRFCKTTGKLRLICFIFLSCHDAVLMLCLGLRPKKTLGKGEEIIRVWLKISVIPQPSCFAALLACCNHHPLHLPMWKSANKHVMWMWYATFATIVNIGRICGLQ